MTKQVEYLARGLRLAEQAHAEYEKRTFPVVKREWPEFYAQWLVDFNYVAGEKNESV